MESGKLRSTREFDHVYRRGRLTRSAGLVVRTAPNHRPISRLAVVVSRKVSHSAVRRNRLRRQVKEVWRKLGPRQTSGQDVIMTVVQDREHSPAEIEAALKQSGLIT